MNRCVNKQINRQKYERIKSKWTKNDRMCKNETK